MTETGPGMLALPVLPLRDTVVFPEILVPIAVSRPGSVAAIDAALATEEKTLVVSRQRDATNDTPGLTDLHRIGTRAMIRRMERSDVAVQVLLQGLDRVEILELDKEAAYLSARVRPVEVSREDGVELEAMQRAVVELGGEVLSMIGPHTAVVAQNLGQLKDPLQQVFLIASLIHLDADKQQALLETRTQKAALELLHGYLGHERNVLRLRREITSQTETELSKEQREFFLRRQLRAIQEELGEASPEQAEVNELRERIETADLPEAVRKEADRELSRLQRLPSSAPDYQLTRTFLELIAELPWKKVTTDVMDLERARKVLDEDHHDLEDVKERILEHLAVLKLNPEAHAPILCFVGPPGVGKTSLGQSIARAIGREFGRMSLGGLHDEAELRGHRRTYIGAMPGRIIQAIRRAGVRNPLLMLDEVDKLGRDFRGDPAAALLEILDPAQNHEFRDNYLDLPFDLSKVFFIVTANMLDTVPRPLLDRLEVLRLAGYSDDDKRHIARRYLLPRQLAQTGLTAEQMTIPDETLDWILRRYTREAGVRELERTLGSLCRKVAVRFATGRTEPVTVRREDLQKMLGPEKFFPEDVRKELPAGVAAGLAWTPAGGDVLYVEAMRLPQRTDVMLTGQLGSVMQESAHAAHSFVTQHLLPLEVDKERLRQGVHIHVPAGATQKDGPSAGVTIATALASVYAGTPVRSDTAMTGEITLTGLVLPVGGIKEKLMAAHRTGIRRVILPERNRQDVTEVPEAVREQLELVFVRTIRDALAAAMTEMVVA